MRESRDNCCGSFWTWDSETLLPEPLLPLNEVRLAKNGLGSFPPSSSETKYGSTILGNLHGEEMKTWISVPNCYLLSRTPFLFCSSHSLFFTENVCAGMCYQWRGASLNLGSRCSTGQSLLLNCYVTHDKSPSLSSSALISYNPLWSFH